jgi:hypothetical protein
MRLKAKSLIWIRIEVAKIQERLKNGAVEAHIGGLEVQNGALEGLYSVGP